MIAGFTLEPAHSSEWYQTSEAVNSFRRAQIHFRNVLEIRVERQLNNPRYSRCVCAVCFRNVSRIHQLRCDQVSGAGLRRVQNTDGDYHYDFSSPDSSSGQGCFLRVPKVQAHARRATTAPSPDRASLPRLQVPGVSSEAVCNR
jgi:hypothetical protein